MFGHLQQDSMIFSNLQWYVVSVWNVWKSDLETSQVLFLCHSCHYYHFASEAGSFEAAAASASASWQIQVLSNKMVCAPAILMPAWAAPSHGSSETSAAVGIMTASPQVHLWNPFSRRAAIATTILVDFYCKQYDHDMTYMREQKLTLIKWWCKVETVNMPFIIMSSCAIQLWSRDQKLLLHNCTQSHTLEKTLTKSRERRGTPSHVFHMC